MESHGLERTDRDLESGSLKKSVDTLRQFYDNKARQAKEASLKVEESVKRTDHDLKPHSTKKSVSMLCQFYEEKIGKAEKSSSKVKESVKRPLNVEDVATSSETHDVKEKKIAMLKAMLDSLGEELSDLGRRRQSGLARSDCVSRIKRIGEEIEIFDKKHFSYIYDNCEVDPAIMDVRGQFEFLQKEYKERKADMLQAKMDLLIKRLSDLDKSYQSSSEKLRDLRTMEGLEVDVEKFGQEYSSYIERNWVVDPAIMGVRNQLESLRKECHEKRITMLKTTLDFLGEQLSDLDRSHQSSFEKLYNLITMKDLITIKGLEGDIERFGREHSSYLRRNCEVDPAIMGVRNQFESLRKECQEKKAAVMKATLKAMLDSLGRRLSYVDRDYQFCPDQFCPDGRHDLKIVKSLEEEIESFGDEHTSYIECNCEVDPAIMDVRDQLEFLRKECQEKKAAVMKTTLDFFGKRLSKLDRRHRSSTGGLRSLKEMERLEEDIERFSREHTSYIERNSEVDPVIMDVRDQLESLRRKCQEKKEKIKERSNVEDVATSSKTSDVGEANKKEKEKKGILAELKEEIDSLTKRLDGLRIEQFASGLALKKQELYADFNDIEQLQKLQSKIGKEIYEIENNIKNISKLCFNYSVEFSEEGIIINLAENSEVDPATKAVQDQCLSLMGDLKVCAKRFAREEEIIDKIINKE